MKLVFFILLTLITLALSAPTGIVEPRAILTQATDEDLFTISLADFITRRETEDGPSGLDWSSDGCTAAPNNPLGFDFLECCERHDFGYRNYKQQGRFNPNTKPLIDKNFKKDMFGVCANETFNEACEATALLYYEVVKFLGSKREAAVLEAREALEKALEDAATVDRESE